MESQRVVPIGLLDHEISAGGHADRTRFDQEGYAVGRQVLAPEIVREVRAPVVAALIEDGQVEPVEGDTDRFRWVGDPDRFDRVRYQERMQLDLERLLLASGLANQAVEWLWGRRAAFWERAVLYVLVPGNPTRVHRDGWQKMGIGGPESHFNFWLPLTRLDEGDGALAVAVGSHGLPDQPARVPMLHPIHREVLVNTGQRPVAEVLAPLWRTTRFEVGDALLFRPDIVHSTTLNTGCCLRMALGMGGQDADVPLAVKAGLSLDRGRDLADVEWLTLAMLAVQPSTPWLARCACYPRGIIGRLGVALPDYLVERAFMTLEARCLIEPHEPYDEQQGWIHRYYHITPSGRAEVAGWLTTPGSGTAYLLALKLLFCNWLGLDTTTLLATREPA